MSGPYYVAMHKGFLCQTPERGYYLTYDVRFATPFPSFQSADLAAQGAAIELSAKLAGVEYYAVLIPAVSGFAKS